jgi:tRNA threonylcarbamoyladenosine biosynthesis protein TsaE
MKRYVSHSIPETEKIAHDWVSNISKGTKATIFGLSGDLGAGKTAFVKAVAKDLGITEDVTSPTFVIEKIYQLPTNTNSTPFSHLIHIDAYRIEDSNELLVLGWEKIISDPSNLILIEWPENIKAIFPANAGTIKCESVDETTRAYTIE